LPPPSDPEGAPIALIITHELTRRFGDVTALNGLTVSIEPGITGLVGSNGAGKSTLVRILLGLLEPSSGSATVLGHDVQRESGAIRSLVGYMPEHDCLPPEMTAAEFVSFMARCSGLPATAARERAAEVLRHVGLFEERYRPMRGYSTGMAQRVKLAQALVHDPRVLVLDEPTNGLDPAGRDEMLALIQRTGREFGISVLVSSHLLGELERVCDHVVLIDAGRLVRAERLGALTGETGTLLVEVDGDVEAYCAALVAHGLVVQRDRLRVLVELPSGDDAESVARVFAAHDTVRDVAVATGAGLLRIARRRGHLEDLFAGATS
jgi:ABC-2 type transport system ATP-binding protein